MCTIQDTVQVTFGDDPPIVIKSESWTEVDGLRFLRLAKSECYVTRLLTGKAVSKCRSLARTDILEQLIAIRNEQSDELLRSSMPGLGNAVVSRTTGMQRVRKAAEAASPPALY